ncbi:hypothetical protein [Chitinophaga sp. Ak27]|uniref:hypothetical protein n=1 Tax=Chitinophaga sp. Ak27 TaxID=2726116 RepID=UPI00145FAB9B|nr:hypothetical protein [Chitinophaga sp. Ak27]NLU91361.1 hypothetical protein [Chitinophaga sp. Ak27]
MITKKILPKFLDVKDWQILRVIAVYGNKYYPFIGLLPYTRTLNKNYDWETGDTTDAAILQEIQRLYPDSVLIEHSLIALENELEEKLQRYARPFHLNFELTLFPSFPYEGENLGKYDGMELTSYTYPLSMRLDREPKMEMDYIFSSSTVRILYNHIDEIASSIGIV